MNAELQERQREFESARQQMVELVAGLADDQFNRRPRDTRWSMAECIDRLIKTGWQLVPRMDTAVVRAGAKGWCAEGPFRYGPLGERFVKAIGDGGMPPQSRLKAPRRYTPQPPPDWKIPQAVEEFSALQEKFVQIVRRADGLDLARTKVASPVTRLLRLSLGQWLQDLSGHQRRHLWQAKQVRLELLG